jgi:probable HAF family extracellular repeat protein
VGYSYLRGDSASHATLWNGRGAIDLGTLGGTNSNAQAINDAGLIAGTSDLKNDTLSRATLWRGTAATNLGALRAQDSSGAYGINKDGAVVGYNRAPTARTSHATLWANGCIYDLNNITDLGRTGLTLVQANAINDRGQIVGYGMNANSETRAVLLTPTGTQQRPPCTRPAL